MIDSVSCPVCRTSAHKRAVLTDEQLRLALAEFYGEPVPKNVDIGSYDIAHCGGCDLEFAWPLTPGNATYYRWITHQPFYYPRFRTEWNLVLQELSAHGGRRVLEVGSGWGDFLRYATSSGLEAVGIDLTESSVAVCRARGLDVHCTLLSDFAQSRPTDRYDAVVAFHCLEHVPDPVGLVRDMLSLVSPTGYVYVSVPNSPMSFETSWFDPMNHPPHHLTRWSPKSMERLLQEAGAKEVRVTEHDQETLFRRTCEALNRKFNSYSRRRRIHHLLPQLARHPRDVLREVRAQVARGESRGDLLLARAR